MAENSVDSLCNDLIHTQEHIEKALAQTVADQDWRPAAGAWSLRYIAAHLAVTEEECFAARLGRLIEEDNPQFEYYDNAQRNFDGYDLLDSLERWKRQRKRILDEVRELSSEDLRRTGRHAVYGELNVIGLLQLMLEHDEEHKAELGGLLEQYLRARS